jgi:hypothetical protein
VANPAYRAYTVVKREGKDDFWLNLGVAFAHEDGATAATISQNTG